MLFKFLPGLHFCCQCRNCLCDLADFVSTAFAIVSATAFANKLAAIVSFAAAIDSTKTAFLAADLQPPF